MHLRRGLGRPRLLLPLALPRVDLHPTPYTPHPTPFTLHPSETKRRPRNHEQVRVRDGRQLLRARGLPERDVRVRRGSIPSLPASLSPSFFLSINPLSPSFSLYRLSISLSAGWGGLDCSAAPCAGDCSGHGICANGTCACDAGWGGGACMDVICPRHSLTHSLTGCLTRSPTRSPTRSLTHSLTPTHRGCSGHGTCEGALGALPECVCDGGPSPLSLSASLPPSCPSHLSLPASLSPSLSLSINSLYLPRSLYTDSPFLARQGGAGPTAGTACVRRRRRLQPRTPRARGTAGARRSGTPTPKPRSVLRTDLPR